MPNKLATIILIISFPVLTISIVVSYFNYKHLAKDMSSKSVMESTEQGGASINPPTPPYESRETTLMENGREDASGIAAEEPEALEQKEGVVLEEVADSEIPIANKTPYTVHKNITATVFWIGEPKGGGSSENNALSAWDDKWQDHYGGYDDYINRNGFYPATFTPKENPFYFDLPYNDFNDDGIRKKNAYDVVPWAHEKEFGTQESMLKNRWAKIMKGDVVCYGQWEDAGPYVYDDHEYVFGSNEPKNTRANNAGMDVSPALRDCLAFEGLNNADNKIDWQFVDLAVVPEGPWTEIITVSQVYWP